MKNGLRALKFLSLVELLGGIEKNEKLIPGRSSGVLEIIFNVKIFENEFLRGRPGSARVRAYYHRMRHVEAHLFYLGPKLRITEKKSYQRKTAHFYKNVFFESAFFPLCDARF